MSIHFYIQKNNLNEIIKLVKNNISVNEVDNIGWPALMSASYYGHFKIVKYLVEHNADINAKNHDNDNDTSLLWASQEGHFKIVKYLVKHGALINNINDYEYTPLYLAVAFGRIKIVKFLLKHGAFIKNKNENENRNIMFKNIVLKRIKF